MGVEFFDIAAAPTAAKVRLALDELGGPEVTGMHVYLGGHRCLGSGYTPKRIEQYHSVGVRRFLLTYVGDQKSDPLGRDRGAEQGQDACELAAALGWTRGAPLVTDLEAFTFDAKPTESIEYVAGWCAAVRAAGYRAGLYSPTRAAVAAARTLSEQAPDFVWLARWLGHTRQPVDPHVVKGIASTLWPRKGQRAWQYAGELRDADGKRLRCRLAGMDVDLDVADDGLMVGPPGHRPRLEALVGRARNPDVTLFQRQLRQVDAGRFAALNPSGATGFYGDETTAMCQAFQRAQGWRGPQADGFPGALTLARLFP